ncbi:FAD binding domain-containing protein [Solirubrobacter soli]|uniref:FAD binding domain-containing protein n=1 Tax=Solirubrobacter soli TaxID=363832 RepID=UPI0004174CB4|nr:FAD binding domain-containing protein [Solirubrobacter soli]
MKPAAFEYVAARSVDEALEALAVEGARVLAGGQSLMPLLNAREVRPSRLVDINHAGLGVIRRRDGALSLGATVRQAALLRSAIVLEGWPLLALAAAHVGTPATRTRGTVGGSLMHDDPRAALPAALAALDAHPKQKDGLLPFKLLLEIEVPPMPKAARCGYAQFARTRGVFPDAGAAVVVAPGHVAIALLGTGRAARAEAAVRAGASAREAGEIAAELVEGDHRRALVADVTRRALEQAGRR